MGTAQFALQQAVYQRCVADSVLAGLVTGVFDAVPENEAFPYLVVGEATETPQNTFKRRGRRTTITSHAWSQARSTNEVTAILARLYQLLHRQTLATVAGYTNVLALYDMEQVFPDADGISIHGFVRYLFFSEEGVSL